MVQPNKVDFDVRKLLKRKKVRGEILRAWMPANRQVPNLLEGAGVELEPADPQTGGYDARESPVAAAFCPWTGIRMSSRR
jgi:hypothetical protein